MALVLRSIRYNSKSLSKLIMYKTISTTKKVSDAVEELKSNPYFDKYADKIAKFQQSSPEEFVSRIETNKTIKNPRLKAEKRQEPLSSGMAKNIVQPKVNFTKTKKLSDIMKTELLSDKSASDIEHLWLDYHKNKDAIAAVIPKEKYETVFKRGQEFNTFLLPLPRNQGFEFIVLQFNGHEIHFTPLIAYQTHKENAPECLTIVHYTDLMDEKGVVLLKGEYNTDILQSHEAQCLVNQLQLYYCQSNDKRLKLMHRFTYDPDQFKHMDLIAELECLSL